MSAPSPAPPARLGPESPAQRDERPPVTIVTGAGGGIGRAVVAALLTAGSTVVATDVSEPALASLLDEHPGSERLHARTLDVTDSEAVEATIDEIERELGPIDGLVSAHGILRASSAISQLDDDWTAVHEVNVGGVMRVSRAVTRRMAARQRGAVVTIGSNAAAVARDGLSAYASSKAAAKHYTLCLGVELAPLGIRCNVVSPGSTDTPMLGGAWARPAEPAGRPGSDAADGEPRPTAAAGALEGSANRRAIAGTPEAFWPGIPLGRIARPEWIADAVVFLLSPQARHIALHDLRVDGGATLGA